ncbi:MAG: flagellar hook-basal body complex protein [Helicobacteraceae bacterium]|jgi:flagellar hook-basal body protein|nr:flagellar hook-basal body complex protein [Helicobacteraceae bacterium]
MNGGFWSALTGAKTNQTAIDTTANNIANINTTGYRASVMEFGALFSRYLSTNSGTLSSDDGVGVKTSATAIDLRSGARSQTDNVFDVAINEDGWFGVVGSNIYDAKEIAYTRDGAFSRDANGNVVTQNGNYLLGTSWGNMINENGMWKIVPNANAGEIAPVAAQKPVIAPENIVYPPSATKNAALNANLPSLAAASAAANANAPLKSLYDQNGAFMGLKSGDNLLIAAGDNDGVFAALGEIKKTITINPHINSPLSFELNGAAINVSWALGASEDEIGEAITNAINASGVANAARSGANIAISSQNALSIANSSDPFLAPLNAAIWTAGENDTLEGLQEALAQTARAIYPQANFLVDYNGRIAANSLQNLSLLVADGGNSPQALLSAFAAFDGLEKTAFASGAFKQSAIGAEQKAISPNGESLVLSSEARLVAPSGASVGATYEAEARLKRLETMSADSDLGAIVQSGKALGLKGGENLWFSFGKQPVSTANGLGLSLRLSGDQSDGAAPFVRFTLDGATYEHIGADGDGATDIASAIGATLEAAGYQTSRDGATLTVYPKGDSLHFTNGASSLPNVDLASASFGRVTYSQGETIGEYIGAINQIANLADASVGAADGKITLSNGAGQTLLSGVYSAENSPEGLARLFSPLNATLTANASASSASLEAYKTISVQTKTIAFDQNGAAIGAPSVVLDNYQTPIDFKFNLQSNNGFAQSASLSADGVIEGNLERYAIDERGNIIAVFDNGKQSAIAQIAVYHFANDQGLMRIGSNQFMQSANSGEPFFYVDSNGAQLPLVTANTLESSNVQAATALSDLIIYQRSYEGAAKAITTNDQLIQNAINLKR